MKERFERTDRGELFAAVNSGRGFLSFYPQIFERGEIKRRYLIKGGPGTGKSTFMRRTAECAESEGLSVEYYRCSSDPRSLDAVVIGGDTAVLDATSPHCVDATLPGVRDEIIDLGVFWNGDGLYKERQLIEKLSNDKANAYRGAYRFLEAALAVSKRNAELAAPLLRMEKLKRTLDRTIGRIPAGSGYELRVGVRDSIGMRGRKCLDTYERDAKKLYVIEDAYGSGTLFLAMLAERAVDNGNVIRVSYSPIDPDRLDAVAFLECGSTFVVLERDDDSPEYEGAVVINMKRFIASELFQREDGRRIRREYKANMRLYKGLLQAATDQLAQAGEYHFELEKIYERYMDFAAQERFARSMVKLIVARACCVENEGENDT